ncbi:adenylate kinase [Parenemella sanctibonifatiensis]|uniref:Adenylate kinase n=1 Tax=Parenemella sanctibonifatiensis TaxID=2016505 RepID=A0A255EBY9_9ACTN|nr:adenylate kinase [Parenemella sanctibonifatiensis]OYN89067.1 adenylate kinase [Parenemella sanctibonifatiensis]
MSQPDKVVRLLIMGPPGAGKGTQATGIAQRYGIPAISTGDMFRANVSQGTPLGLEVKRIMDAGGYVSDEITTAIVADRLGEPDTSNGWLLDGYPRTLAQVEALDRLAGDEGIDAVVVLEADEEELVARLAKRAQEQGRSDDNEETIRTRLKVYAEQTQPLLDVYAGRDLVVAVDGLGQVDEVGQRIAAALEAKLEARG